MACRACRARKVKCDRAVPRCSNCCKYTKTCIYPSSMLKPGPKPGSIQRKRRYRHVNEPQDDAIPPHLKLILNGPTSNDAGAQYTQHLQAITDLCHATNESRPLGSNDPFPTCPTRRRGDFLRAACHEFGISMTYR
ncbi:hypothetical protein BJX66DRAFT_84156 [Aspergillus keveii]|uniref:Zn(2)-C6 fungal-type domain-containing protein n=1 Tax=Aspergillus keveii TaxID=714993 RepID=A0ABR4FN31_9EURO